VLLPGFKDAFWKKYIIVILLDNVCSEPKMFLCILSEQLTNYDLVNTVFLEVLKFYSSLGLEYFLLSIQS
jgi:hypothetical protein